MMAVILITALLFVSFIIAFAWMMGMGAVRETLAEIEGTLIDKDVFITKINDEYFLDKRCKYGYAQSTKAFKTFKDAEVAYFFGEYSWDWEVW